MKETDRILLTGVIILVLLMAAPAAAVRSMTINAGNGQTATVASALAVSPSIRITDDGDPVSGVRVTFTVTGGGGTVTGPVAVTNANGIATVGSWRLGTQAGTNALRAANGSLAVAFTATGTAGAATRMEKYGGDGQSAAVSTAVAIPPSVRVFDVYQNPVPGRQVLFTVSVGGGTVVPVTALSTNANGIAAVTQWNLGPSPGTNSLVATSGALSPVTFVATAIPSVSTPQISGISPAGAVNTGSQTLEITGTGFSSPTVILSRTGQPTLTGAVAGTDTATRISRTFNLNGAAPGTWNLIVLNTNGKSDTGLFVVRSSGVTVSSISPNAGTANTTVQVTISGTGFAASLVRIRLYRGSNYISGSVHTGGTSTKVTGTFNLNQAVPGTYDVCVLPNGTEAERICGPLFRVHADRGSILVISSPTGATVYLNNVFIGHTPITSDGILPGTHTVLVRNQGYADWTEGVRVTPGNVTTVDATLAPAPPTPVPTTITTVTTAPPPITGPIPTTKPLPVDPVLCVAVVVLMMMVSGKR